MRLRASAVELVRRCVLTGWQWARGVTVSVSVMRPNVRAVGLHRGSVTAGTVVPQNTGIPVMQGKMLSFLVELNYLHSNAAVHDENGNEGNDQGNHGIHIVDDTDEMQILRLGSAY